ncbi:MAG: hypothetical protein JXR31_00920 [Prolixibacteraceae bacterium]|nr:hypothetical protein [Prolixibacteraceae bacterium]
MKKIVIFLFFLLIIFGCEEDEYIPTPKLLNCRVEYLNFNDDRRFIDNEYSFAFNSDTMSFKYSNGNIIKTFGGFQLVPNGTNMFARIYIGDVYDSLIYYGNKIAVFTRPENPYFLSDRPKYGYLYELDENGKLIKFTRRDGVEFNYIYQDSVILEKKSNDVTFRKFYMENDNLVKVVSENYYNDELIYRKEILFQKFDKNPNPLKNKYYILGVFFRAFSENNYEEFTINEYGKLNDGTFGIFNTFWFSMPIYYNDNNYPMFGDYE